MIVLGARQTEATNQTLNKAQTTAVKLIDGSGIFHDELLRPYLQSDSEEYVVVGAIGLQGVGKSTLLSTLADISDPSRRGTAAPFPRQNQNLSAQGLHQTTGVDAYVTGGTTRIVLIDVQPLLSASVALRRAAKQSNASHGGGRDSAGIEELESLKFATLILRVCHVVILVQDGLLEYSLMDVVKTAQMLNAMMGSPHHYQEEKDHHKRDSHRDSFSKLIVVANRTPPIGPHTRFWVPRTHDATIEAMKIISHFYDVDDDHRGRAWFHEVPESSDDPITSQDPITTDTSQLPSFMGQTGDEAESDGWSNFREAVVELRHLILSKAAEGRCGEYPVHEVAWLESLRSAWADLNAKRGERAIFSSYEEFLNR